jgi:hypothetical protein
MKVLGYVINAHELTTITSKVSSETASVLFAISRKNINQKRCKYKGDVLLKRYKEF